jgi:hypothetical protein
MGTLTARAVAGIVTVLSLVCTVSALQDSKSAAAAKELTQILDAAKLDAIAAVDPADPGAFVAALYISGSQLLVVSAKYAAPSLLVSKIKTKEYRDIYIDLSAASIAGSKTFIIDYNCNGLMARTDDNGAPDSWEAGKQQVSFDGDWRKAKMTEADYMKTFSEADARYAKIIGLLAAQAKQ